MVPRIYLWLPCRTSRPIPHPYLVYLPQKHNLFNLSGNLHWINRQTDKMDCWLAAFEPHRESSNWCVCACVLNIGLLSLVWWVYEKYASALLDLKKTEGKWDHFGTALLAEWAENDPSSFLFHFLLVLFVRIRQGCVWFFRSRQAHVQNACTLIIAHTNKRINSATGADNPANHK